MNFAAAPPPSPPPHGLSADRSGPRSALSCGICRTPMRRSSIVEPQGHADLNLSLLQREQEACRCYGV